MTITITTTTWKSSLTGHNFTQATIRDMNDKNGDTVQKSYNCTEEQLWKYLMDCFTVFETEELTKRITKGL